MAFKPYPPGTKLLDIKNAKERLTVSDIMDRRRQSSYETQLRLQSVRTGMDFYDFIKPIILFVVIGVFLVGPATIGLAGVFANISWYWWVLLVFLVLWLWRSLS